MSLTDSDVAAAAELVERPLAGGISQDALEAICSEFGEDKSTLVDLYQAAKDENELLEFKNYELQFKIQELEFRQGWAAKTGTNAIKMCDQEQTQPNANQCQLLDEQKATATSGTPTTNSQPDEPQVAPAAERASDNNGQRRPTGQAAVGAQSTSVNFEHENDDLNNAPNESGNKRQVALSRIVGVSAREPQQQQQCEPVTSERANNENIESGLASPTTSSSTAATAVNQTKNGISFARSTTTTTMNAAGSGQCQLAGDDANERGQSPEDAATTSGSRRPGNKVEHDGERVEMGARKTNISPMGAGAGGRPQTNDAPDCGASPLALPPCANQWPGGASLEYNDQQPLTGTCSLEQPPGSGKIIDSTRSESLAPISLAKGDRQVSSSSGQSASDKPTPGMARIAKPVQRSAVSAAKAKSNATATNRVARNRAHSITGSSRSSSAAATTVCRQTATVAVNKSAPPTARTTNPMRARSKSSLADQRALACSVNQRLQRQPCGDSSSSPSGAAASISLHLHRRLAGSSSQLNQQQQQQLARQLMSRSVSSSRVCTGASSSASSSSSQAKLASNKWPAPAIKRSLTTGNFVTHSVSQIPTLIDQSHAKLRRPSHGNGSASARLEAAGSPLMGAADHDEPNDDRDQFSKSLGNLFAERPIAGVAPEASHHHHHHHHQAVGKEQPVRVHTLSKSCVQMNEIADVSCSASSSTSAKQLVPSKRPNGEEINQTGPVSNHGFIGTNDEEQRAASCLQCKLFESKLDLLGRERALLSEQLSELEELENDSRLASQKLAAQVGALEQQLDQCKFELARSCESESRLRFQNKRLHFELRQRQECVQSLQQQLNELRSRARALFRLHREGKHQRQSGPDDIGVLPSSSSSSRPPPPEKANDEQESRPPSRRASLAVDSCASSQTYDSAYSKSSSSSGSSSSTNSEVDCCEETEESPRQRQQHEKIEETADDQPTRVSCEPTAKANDESCASSSCDESEHIQEDDEQRQQTTTIEVFDQGGEQPASGGGHCLALANRQQVLKKRISIARILRGIQVQQQQPQPQTEPEQPGQLSISDAQRARVDQCAQAAAVNGCQTARIARVDQQQRESARAALAAQTNQSSEQSNQTSSGVQLPSADGHRDGPPPPVKQQRRPAQSGGKSPIELALEGVSELERTLAADEALQSLCQSKQGDEVVVATKTEGESSGESSRVATSDTCQLIDGLKSEVSNLQMRLMQANTLNDNLILELKSQQRQVNLTASGCQRKGQAATTVDDDDEPRERSLSLVNATGQHKEQPGGAHLKSSSSVIYVNGLNASVTHHHHHYEPPVLPPRPHQQLARPNHQAVSFGRDSTTATTVDTEATYCHNCCHTNRRQFHAAAGQFAKQQHQQQQYRHSTGTIGHHYQQHHFQQQQNERELADFLKFLQEKLHFHHGRTFELVNECQKLAMNALLASYNQRVGLAHHQRVVLMGNQAAAACAAAQQRQQQRQCLIEPTSSELLPPVRPPPRRRTRMMVIGQQPQQLVQHSPMGFVGQPAAAADAGHSMTRADQNNNNASFSQAAPPATTTAATTRAPSALQVAKQTLFSLVPIYYSSSSCNNKQQPVNNNKEEATMKSSQAAAGLASAWTNNIQLASDQSNSTAAGPLQRRHWIASDQYNQQAATTQVQINGTNDIYATVSRTPGQSASRQANRVSILKISGCRNDLAQMAKTTNIVRIASGDLNQQQLAQGDNKSQPQLSLHANDHHRLASGGGGQQRAHETINQAPAQQQQHYQHHQRPGQLLASVKDALSEEIERFRVHANGQLLDLLTRQNWCESLVTDKLKAIETRQAQHWQANGLTPHGGGSISGGNSGQTSKSISLQLQATNNDILGLDNLTSRNQVSSGAKIHMLERSTLYCNGVKMTQSAGSRPTSSVNVPTKTISQSVSLNDAPRQQRVHGISRPDCSVTDSLC